MPRKPRRLTFALTALCALALALAAGCGGDDANQFREDYNTTVDRLSTINGEIGSATSGSAGESSAAIAKQLDEIADAAEKARSELADLDPPEDANWPRAASRSPRPRPR
jgi:methyl-accepting chemotaxis protein